MARIPLRERRRLKLEAYADAVNPVVVEEEVIEEEVKPVVEKVSKKKTKAKSKAKKPE